MENISEMNRPVLYGWICPICGRSNSPFTSTCPCKPFDYRITCGSTTDTPMYTTAWNTTTTGGTINETR